MTNQSTLSLKDIIKEEYSRCLTDPAYFIKRFCIIQHPVRGKIPFILYQFQENVLAAFIKHSRNIILKNRQMGLSTLAAAYALWLMTFFEDKNILVIATKQGVAKNIISKVRLMHRLLPSWMKRKCIEDNKLGLSYDNGSKIFASTSAGDSGRSEAVSLLILDEAAFIPRMEELWGALQPTLSTGGDIIVLSTPNGVGNWYHETFTKAEEGKNNFFPITLHWTLHPEKDQEWRDAQDVELGVRLAKQECFDGNTKIFTINGYKNIKDIQVGDLVLTHTGKFKPVIKLYNKKSKDLYKINSFLNENYSYVTKNHPFLFNNIWTEINKINNLELLPVIPTNIEFNKDKIVTIDLYNLIEPKNFKKKLCNDNMSFYINDRKHKRIHNRYISVDYDLGYIIGIYLSEGTCDRLRFWISHHTKEADTWVKDVIKIIKNKFGLLEYQQRFGKIGINNGAQTTFCSEILCNTLKLFVDGNYCYDKHLSNFAYENSNLEFLKGVLDGTFVGDGMLNYYNYKSLGITSINMIYDIKFICHILGINCCSFRPDKSILPDHYHRPYTFKILNSKNIDVKLTISNIIEQNLHQTHHFHNYKSDDRFVFSKINKEEYIGEEISVYNLEVEEDNSYITEHFIVHNCDGSFLASGDTVISGEILEWYKQTQVMEPTEKTGFDRNVWIWEYPDAYKTYILVADVARGDGRDYSTFQILETETLNQVAEYQGKPGTQQFGDLCVEYATKYNDALLIVENASVGWAVLQRIIDRSYKNIFYSENKNVVIDNKAASSYSGKMNSNNKKSVAGFTTSTATRPLIISKLESYIGKRELTIRSTRLINELFTFVWNAGKAEAASDNYNDDLILAYSIGLWVRDTALKLIEKSKDLVKSTLTQFKVEHTTINDRGIYRNIPTSDPFILPVSNEDKIDTREFI